MITSKESMKLQSAKGNRKKRYGLEQRGTSADFDGYLQYATLDGKKILLNGQLQYKLAVPKKVSVENVEAALYDGCTKHNINYVSEDNVRKLATEINEQHQNVQTYHDAAAAFNGKPEKEEPKKGFHVYKYSGTGYLVESVKIAGKPCFVKYGDDRKVSISDSIEEPNRVLKPFDEIGNAAEPFSFVSLGELQGYIERAKKVNLDYLWKCAYWFVDRCIDTNVHNKNILTASIIFGYFQDRLPSTFYLYPVGKPGSGKGAMLTTYRLLGYRAVSVSSATTANIYNVLGVIERGQVTLCVDEANRLDQQPDMQEILKTGFKVGGRVPRILDASSAKLRSQEFYYTFCFKIICSEKELRDWLSEGLLTRIFYLHCMAGEPKFIADKIEEPSGDAVYEELKERSTDLRRLLFAYRLVHHADRIRDLRLNLSGRESELAEPLIRLFRDSTVIEIVKETLFHFVNEKRQRSIDGFEYELFRVVKELVDEQAGDVIILESSTIRDVVKRKLQGTDIPDKPMSFLTAGYGEVSTSRLAGIIKGRFAAKLARIGADRKRGFAFDKNKLQRAGKIYESLDGIEILPPTMDGMDGLDGYPGDNSEEIE